MALVLVGLMGSGKTTVGRLVAERTGRDLVDADEAIEARTGRTVRELWEEGGEAAYRQMESQVVIDAIEAREPCVIAAPAGAVLDPRVREALDAVLVVWLRARPTTVADRVEADDHRPLLGDQPLAVLSEMASSRRSLYEDVADAIIDIDGLGPEEVADRVLRVLITPDHLRTGP